MPQGTNPRATQTRHRALRRRRTPRPPFCSTGEAALLKGLAQRLLASRRPRSRRGRGRRWERDARGPLVCRRPLRHRRGSRSRAFLLGGALLPLSRVGEDPAHSVDHRLRIVMDVLHGGAVRRRAYRTPGKEEAACRRMIEIRQYLQLACWSRKIVDQHPDNRPRSENRNGGDTSPALNGLRITGRGSFHGRHNFFKKTWV